MPYELLRVVPDAVPDVRPVIRRLDEDRIGPLFISFGDVDLICGDCTFLLVRGARGVQDIVDAVVVCPNCGAANEAHEGPGLSA
ncbi:hypothetical protein ACT8ZV_18680 [Nocardioides sp. MAHUQ-72]|uniref:hypothetical protein n=1 Tax=unclassified Nocardioides TaxID=2615069 RepID=UPI00361210A0